MKRPPPPSSWAQRLHHLPPPHAHGPLIHNYVRHKGLLRDMPHFQGHQQARVLAGEWPTAHDVHFEIPLLLQVRQVFGVKVVLHERMNNLWQR